MRKRILVLGLSVIFIALMCLSVNASNNAVVDDGADLLSTQEKNIIQQSFEKIGSNYDVCLLFVSLQQLKGQSIESYAKSYYASHGKGADAQDSAIILVIDMGNRYMWLETFGRGYQVISDARREDLFDIIQAGLSGNSLCSALEEYASQIDYYFEYEGREKEVHFFENWLNYLITSLSIGFVISLIVVFSMKSKLNSIKAKNHASDYAVKDSFALTLSREIFLYHTLSRVPIPQNNNNGRSGSKGHSSGGGRHF